jgi:MSHA biogenesis protein MshO
LIHRHFNNQGFTLIELVMTIVLTGLFFSTVSIFMKYPLLAYAGVVNTATLVDNAEIVLQSMRLDIQGAVPNSIRVKIDSGNPNRVALEFLNTVESIPYVATGTGALSFSTPGSSSFMTLGLFNTAPSNTTCAANNCRLIVDNATDGGVYSTSPVVITPSSTTVTFGTVGGPPATQAELTLNNPVLFANPSPAQLLYVSDTPVSYVCDVGAQTLNRYWGYAITSVQGTDPTISPLSSATTAPLANNVTACTFSYTPATSTAFGIVNLVMSFMVQSQKITLMRQITVSNPL